MKLLGSIAIFFIGALMATYAYYSAVSSCSLYFSLDTFQCLQKISIIMGIFSIAVMLTGAILTMNNVREMKKNRHK